MKSYLDLLDRIMIQGVDRPDKRTGVPTRALFALTLRHDMNLGFPALTTKKLLFSKVKAELLFFLSGSQDINDLQRLGGKGLWEKDTFSPTWLPKASFLGDMGRIYGVQWRRWRKIIDKGHWIGIEGVDQIKELVDTLKTNPYSRRLIVSAWNAGEIDEACLPPCHAFFQCFVAEGKLSLGMYQRSCDMFLGVPFNIASYGLLLSMIAQVCDLGVGELIITFGDTHVYHNHFGAVYEQLSRKPLPPPKLHLNPDIKDIDYFRIEDIELVDYNHHPPIKAELNTGNKI